MFNRGNCFRGEGEWLKNVEAIGRKIIRLHLYCYWRLISDMNIRVLKCKCRNAKCSMHNFVYIKSYSEYDLIYTKLYIEH